MRTIAALSGLMLVIGLLTAPVASADQPTRESVATALATHTAPATQAAPATPAQPAMQTASSSSLAAAVDAAVSPAAERVAAKSLQAADPQQVSFAGVSVDVPADWKIVDVDAKVGCVRYDEHAVFVGDPAESACPAHVVGRTSTVQILRAANPASAGADVTPQVVLSDSGDDLLVTVAGEVRVIVTSDYASPASALTIAESVTVDGISAKAHTEAVLAMTSPSGEAPGAGSAASDEASEPQGLRAAGAAFNAGRELVSAGGAQPAASSYFDSVAQIRPAAPAGAFQGMALDTCTAPSVAAMNAWRASSYDAIGVYIGGVMASCKPNTSRNPNLDKAWVDQVARQGWKLIPIYVGLQAPGTRYSAQVDTDFPTATKQGQQAAVDAVNKMAGLGLGAGNPIYYDMEAWNTGDKKANAAVISFMHGWTTKLHQLGYLSGLYSSAYSMKVIADRAVSNPKGFTAPDAVWYARWYKQSYSSAEKKQAKKDGTKLKTRAQLIAAAHVKAQKKVDTKGFVDSAIRDDVWTNHQRGWQYLGGHEVSHGGYKINLDSSLFDGPLAPMSAVNIAISQSSLPNVAYNATYSTTITTKNQKSSYTFSSSGSLPPGLSLSKNGRITGSTSAIGVWTFTVFVTDSKNPYSNGAKTYRISSMFPDVAAGSTFTSDIAWLANNAITTGFEDGKFKPRAMVTRGQMAGYLYRYMHPDAPTAPSCSVSTFRDVPRSNTFCGEIAWLATTGVTTGYDDGRFRPDREISRGEMAAFLYRLQHSGSSSAAACRAKPFSDVSPNATFCGEVAWLSGSGITSGADDGKYHASQHVARQAMAAFLHRMAGKFGYTGPHSGVSV